MCLKQWYIYIYLYVLKIFSFYFTSLPVRSCGRTYVLCIYTHPLTYVSIQHTRMHSVLVVQVAGARDRKRPDASSGPLFPNRPPKPELAKEEDDLGMS